MKVFGKGVASIGLVVFLACGWTASESKAGGSEEKAPVPERVELPADDGLVLIGSYYAPENEGEGRAPGILLLHQMRGKRQDWRELTMELTKRGYAVLAMDLRGHGESTKGNEGKTWDYRTMEKSEYPGMVGDAGVALDYLKARPGVDPERIGIIGASIGANVALNAAANDPAVESVVLLSPGVEYHLIKTEPAMREYKGAVFLAASDEDGYAADSVRKLHELCQGESEMKMYSGAGHGANMFAPTKGDLQERILDWVDRTLVGSQAAGGGEEQPETGK